MKLNLSVKLGLLLGVLSCLIWYLIAREIGFYSTITYKYRLYLLIPVSLIIGIFISVIVGRIQNNGFIEFKEALKKAMQYTLVLATVYAIFNYIYHSYISPDTVDYFLSEAKKYAIAQQMSDAEISKFLDAEKSRFNSFLLFPPIMFFGLILSLLVAAILQKSNPDKKSIED